MNAFTSHHAWFHITQRSSREFIGQLVKELESKPCMDGTSLSWFYATRLAFLHAPLLESR